jgi:hypothetical protein
VRRKAADLLAREALKEYHVNTATWAGDGAALSALATATGDADPKVSENATATLARLASIYPASREAARPVLTRQLGNPAPDARSFAVQGLGSIAGEEVASLLRPLLDDRAAPVRSTVLRMCRAPPGPAGPTRCTHPGKTERRPHRYMNLNETGFAQ